MINEVWKDAPGYEQFYKVSNTGRVFRKVSSKCTKERELHPEIVNGYMRVVLHVGAPKKNVYA